MTPPKVSSVALRDRHFVTGMRAPRTWFYSDVCSRFGFIGTTPSVQDGQTGAHHMRFRP